MISPFIWCVLQKVVTELALEIQGSGHISVICQECDLYQIIGALEPTVSSTGQ